LERESAPPSSRGRGGVSLWWDRLHVFPDSPARDDREWADASGVTVVRSRTRALLVSPSPRAWRFAMRRLSAIVSLIVLPMGAAAADPVPDVKETIQRGLTFLAKDNLAWKEKRQCAECHHAPFTIWALNEGKKRGYAVEDKALEDLTSWVVT